jgi:hypothetical protein
MEPEFLSKLSTAAKGHPVRVRSGGWIYSFYVYKKAARLTVKRRREPRRLDVERVARLLAQKYSCPECNANFTRIGRQRYCSQACKVARRRRKRNGNLWTRDHLSPQAKANQAVADDRYEQRGKLANKAARRELKRHRSE